MKTRPLNKILTGVAGEYFVAAELSRRGYVASLTLRNTRGIDILASNADATISVGIQVKTKYGNKPEWLVSRKAVGETAEKLFYVFVRFKGNDSPKYHIVPRAIVAKYVGEKHKAWLAKPRKDGKIHKDNPLRVFRDRENHYLDKWELLGLGTSMLSTIEQSTTSNTDEHSAENLDQNS